MDQYFQSIVICAVTALVSLVQCLLSRHVHSRPAAISLIFLLAHVFLWCVFELIYRLHFIQYGLAHRIFVMESTLLIPSAWMFLKRYLGWQSKSRFSDFAFFALSVGLALSSLLISRDLLTRFEDTVPTVNFVLLVLVAIDLLILGRHSQNIYLRAHMAMLGVGSLVVAAGFALTYVSAAIDWLPSLGHLFLAVFLYICFYSFKSHRLLNAEQVLSQVVEISLMTMAITLVYRVIVFWTGLDPDFLFFNMMIASFVLWLVFEPMRNGARLFLSKIYMRGQKASIQKVRTHTRTLSFSTNAEQLGQECLQMLSEIFQPAQVAFYSLSPSQSAFVKLNQSVPESTFPQEITALRIASLPPLSSNAIVVDIRNLNAQMQLVDHRYDRAVLKQWLDLINECHAQAMIRFDNGDFVAAVVLMRSDRPLRLPPALNRELKTFANEYARTLRQLHLYRQSSDRERLLDLGLMAAGLAHELKNPLGSIHGAAQILSSHVKDNGQMAPFAQMITEETRRLNALVHQILQFSQGENFGDSFVTVDLAQLVRRTFDRIFSDHSMVLRSSLEGATLPVDGRPELLDLVMTNLFQNIKDATAGLASQDSQRIDITFQRTKDTDGRPWIKLDVSDHGPGMPRDVLDRIFIPYVTTKPGGTGLGMPLVKKALDSHGAKIHVTSQVGHGTKYSLFFRESAKLKPLGKGRNVSAHHSASLDRG